MALITAPHIPAPDVTVPNVTIPTRHAQDEAATAPARAAEPSVMRTCVTSILAMTVVFFFVVAIPSWLAFDDALTGVGLGAMSAIWMGPSFGVVTASARLSEHLHD